MKAMVQDLYGPPDVLSLRDVPMPTVGPDDGPVRVHGAALNVGDCFGVRGAPLPMRLVTGLFRPAPGVPGFVVAGQGEAGGRGVTKFRAGDAVFGAGHGTCAEFASVPEARLAHTPRNLTYGQAASIPIAALAALHGLRDAGKLKPGQKGMI